MKYLILLFLSYVSVYTTIVHAQGKKYVKEGLESVMNNHELEKIAKYYGVAIDKGNEEAQFLLDALVRTHLWLDQNKYGALNNRNANELLEILESMEKTIEIGSQEGAESPMAYTNRSMAKLFYSISAPNTKGD